MTLLAPWAALAAGLAAGATLLLLYFLRLRRRPLRVGSTMLWEQAARDLQVNVPFKMIRRSWLLLLHLLALLLAVTAIGRPAIETDAPAADRLIFIIDHSASMSATDAPDGAGGFRTRLQHAKELTIDEIDAANRSARSVEFTVIASAADAELVEPGTQRASEARAAVRGIEPTDQPGRLGSAAELVATLTAAPPSEDPGAQPTSTVAYLVSDGGGSAGASGNGRPFAVPSLEVVRVHAGPAPDQVGLNFGITALAASRDFEEPRTVRLFARVESNADRQTAATLRLERPALGNGEPAALRAEALAIPAAGDDRTANAVWSAAIDDPEGGPLRLSIQRDDALAADNTAAVVVPPIRAPAVLVAAPPGDDGRPAPDGFLMDVLEALRLRALRVVGPEAGELAAADRRGFDLVILDRVTPADPPAVPSLSFGAGPPGRPGDAGPPEPSRLRNAPLPVLTWDRRHPVLRDVGLGDVQIGRAVPVEPLPAGYKAIARVSAGPIMLAQDAAPRRIVVTFPLSASNWPLDVGFPIFLASAVEHLSGVAGGSADGRAYTTAEPVIIDLPRPIPPGEARLTGPIDRGVDIPAGASTINVGVLPRVGLYRLRASDTERAIAVNLVDSAETSLASRRDADGEADARDTNEGEAALNRQRRELWPWFVLAFTAVLVLEWIVYALRMRV